MKRKKLITRCNYPWGDFSPTHAINPWLGCTFNCDYCWARDRWWARHGKRLSALWGVPDGFKWRVPVLFDDWEEMLEAELLGQRWPSETCILLCSLTDPYIPQEAQIGVTQRILEHLGNANIPTMILTKAAELPARDFDLLKSMDAWFGITMEAHPASTRWHRDRTHTLFNAYEKGIKTFVSLEPWIPNTDMNEVVTILAGFVDHLIVGPLNYKGVDGQFYRDNLPGLIELFERIGASFYIKPDLMRYMED